MSASVQMWYVSTCVCMHAAYVHPCVCCMHVCICVCACVRACVSVYVCTHYPIYKSVHIVGSKYLTKSSVETTRESILGLFNFTFLNFKAIVCVCSMQLYRTGTLRG